MKVILPSDPDYTQFCQSLNRRALPDLSVSEVVSTIIQAVTAHGDAELIRLAEKFDGVTLSPETLAVSEDEVKQARATVTDATREAVTAARRNIHKFSQHSLRQDWSSTNHEGASVGERFRPFQRVGVYIPGGKAPLASTSIMTAAFAQAAGVPEIIAATPCNQHGEVNPAVIYALAESGATRIFKLGGAQAIAALALGTQTVPAVEKIFGPGNSFVVEAKRQLVGAVAIDLLPGPSEVLVIADHSANPAFVAADLLAQAEHGGDSIVGLITTSAAFIDQVNAQITAQVAQLSRGEILAEVLDKHAFALVVDKLETAFDLCNQFAPEHLTLATAQADTDAEQILTAGAIYLGNDSPVAVGDFLAGPSHTLPTGGAGKSFSGLRADQFQRRTSIVKMDPSSVAKSLPHVTEFARLEGLDAHGRSVSIRLE